ncbi:MAG: hypothetical protein HOY71_44525 [Nonomuraea sp.]|nr:hypothetical protein [Nonomuraea sp.]
MEDLVVGAVVRQAKDLLRWRSPLRTELWASRLAAAPGFEEVRGQLQGSVEAELAIAALAAVGVGSPDDAGGLADGAGSSADDAGGLVGGASGSAEGAGGLVGGASGSAEGAGGLVGGASGSGDGGGGLPGWTRRMGQVDCEGAWYGKGDPYGEQVLAALAFRYRNGKEPHVLVVGIDQVNGGLAVDAVVEEVKFLDDLGLDSAEPQLVAGRVLDAFELTGSILGAAVAESLPEVEAFAVARARAVPEPVRHAAHDAVKVEMSATEGAAEAHQALLEFLGDRPLWWSPQRAHRFLTGWLPREAVLSDAAIAAMPDVLRAWTRAAGDLPEVLQQIDDDSPGLPARMADLSLASLRKRLTLPPSES